MKKLYIITFCVLICLTSNAQSYQYQPWQPSMGTLTFNTLGDSQHPYVQCKTGNSWNNPTTIVTPSNASISNPSSTATTHAIINNNFLDPCRCYQLGSNVMHERYLPPSWDGNYQNLQDTVVRIGCGVNNSTCNHAAQIEYWFYPEEQNSTLLVMFSFALINACDNNFCLHGVDINGCASITNQQFYIEVLDGETGQLLDLGYYPTKASQGTANPQPNFNWPYSQFLAWPSGCNASSDEVSIPDNYGISTFYWAGQTNSNPSSYANGFATPTTWPYRECPSNQTGGTSDNYPVQWFEYKPLAFNLKSIASQNVDADGNFTPNKSVKLRIRTLGCSASAHWAYALFTAKMTPGTIQIDACGNEPIHLSAPRGLSEMTYQWHYGYDSLDACNRIIDPTAPIPGVTISSYDIYIDINAQIAANHPVWPYYRCEMRSYTGVPFVYEAHIQYPQIEPDFTFEQDFSSEHVNVQFHDASLVQLITPPGEAGGNFDTLNQAPENIQWYVEQNGNFVLFVDNDPEPVHSFTENEIDENNAATVRIVVSKGNCLKDTTKTIPLSMVSVPAHETSLPTLYPNPTTGIVNLQAGKPVLSVELLTIDGKTLSGECPWQRGNTTGKIDLSAFNPGYYLLVLHYADGKSEQWKIIKQ